MDEFRLLRPLSGKTIKEITGSLKSPACQPAVCDETVTTSSAANMNFTGTWKVYSEENLEEFLKSIGAPQMIIKMRKEVKPVIIIEQNGKDFTCTVKTPVCTKVHSFSLGKESEITTVDGRKFKCIVREENGKLIAENDKFTSVREIQGDEMIETITAGSITFTSRSKRV
ncbi:fatty acid-binding protein 10-A, liver basic-like [Simochromis diagramma]|uniref:fatty acid-binding protein 10-A, liver basic-like n=1 Tax=Simochromis diagramma TaxID=43689 RepID=UPI001A7EBCEF|nr:fatty acid-binding protein 10-A, liver basic-like [Simochromis diagramma]